MKAFRGKRTFSEPSLNLKDILVKVTAKNLHEETDTGYPVGKEERLEEYHED